MQVHGDECTGATRRGVLRYLLLTIHQRITDRPGLQRSRTMALLKVYYNAIHQVITPLDDSGRVMCPDIVIDPSCAEATSINWWSCQRQKRNILRLRLPDRIYKIPRECFETGPVRDVFCGIKEDSLIDFAMIAKLHHINRRKFMDFRHQLLQQMITKQTISVQNMRS